MTISIRFADPLKDERWDAYVSQHKYGSLYHTSHWMNVLKRSFGYRPYYVSMQDSHGRFKGVAPFFLIQSVVTGNRLVSLPFSDYSEILLDDIADIDRFYKFLTQNAIYLNAEYIEIKSRVGQSYYESAGFKRIDNSINHVLRLANRSLEEIQGSFHKSFISRNIRKARKSPLKIIKGATLGDVKTCYNLLLLTRKKHGLPPHPFCFFKNMWEWLPENMLDVYLATENGTAVAGIIVATFEGTAYYLYGGSDSRHTANRPNHLLLWTAIEEAWEKGIGYFDFGRTGLANEGLTDFKRRWGTVETRLPTFWISLNGKKTVSLNRGIMEKNTVNRLIQATPKPLLKIGSRIIYRHLG